MKLFLKEIKINNFRLFENKEFRFSPSINILLGDNASGKTSVLEGISILGVTKSFRTNDDKEIVHKGKDFYFVKGDFIIDEQKEEVIVSYTEKGKKINYNGELLKKLSDFIGKIKVVSFSPEDLLIIKGEPKYKRSFLNQYIGIIENEYLGFVILYNKVLKERNEVLKNIEKYDKSRELIKVYTEKMIFLAKKIIIFRKKYLDMINKFAKEYLKKISSNKEDLRIEYHPSVNENEIDSKIYANLDFDIEKGNTSYGPHKDVFKVFINGMDLEGCGSHGQQKTVAIALKLAIVDIIKERNEGVIVLLDDLFGELDIERQLKLLNELKMQGQVFISTTDISLLANQVIKESKIIKMDEGE